MRDRVEDGLRQNAQLSACIADLQETLADIRQDRDWLQRELDEVRDERLMLQVRLGQVPNWLWLAVNGVHTVNVFLGACAWRVRGRFHGWWHGWYGCVPLRNLVMHDFWHTVAVEMYFAFVRLPAVLRLR